MKRILLISIPVAAIAADIDTARADHCEVNPPPPCTPDLVVNIPDPKAGAVLAPESLTLWPIRARDHSDEDCLGEHRIGMWTSPGEVQNYTDVFNLDLNSFAYLHSGIDIRSHWDTMQGDFTIVVDDADIWTHESFDAADNVNGDLCKEHQTCRLYLKRYPDQRYIYYYAHLWLAAGSGLHQDVREKIVAAAAADPNDPLQPGSNTVCSGWKLSELGPYIDTPIRLTTSTSGSSTPGTTTTGSTRWITCRTPSTPRRTYPRPMSTSSTPRSSSWRSPNATI